MNPIADKKVNTYVTINGKYTDNNGNNLRYTPITITINGIKYTNSTNSNGEYAYTFKVTTLGTNNITVSYLGNSRFIGATTNRSFKVTQ
ncbi:MAG: hypothetical protein E7Z85_07625 [Methanosphaera stadtmanae]|nr:hypothetical protein [Methanosphaera stadtmanae]